MLNRWHFITFLWNSLPDNVWVQTHALCLNHISLAKHSYNASHNRVLQLYLIKRTLLCFSLGWTDNFCLDGTTATLIMSLFVSGLTSRGNEELHKLQSGSTLKWSEMTKHLMMTTPQRKPTISDYTELTTFCHKLIILSFYNINLF